MKTRYLAVVATLAVMLVAATAFATTDSVFAGGGHHKKKSESSQATAQVNDCGNGYQPEDVFCQNLASQIQGNDNSAALAGEQGFSNPP